MSNTATTYALVTSEIETTVVVDGLTIMTQGSQESPTVLGSFGVTVQ